MLQSGSVLLVVGLVAIFTMGCEARPAAPPTDARASVANELGLPSPSSPVGERLLDTSAPQALPPPPRILGITNAPAPVTPTRASKTRKSGSDENLPSWVPVRGRLTVVEAADLAENLGIVPRGTAKANQGRISVAEALAPPASVAAAPIAARSDGGARSATWLASNGRVRHGRGR